MLRIGLIGRGAIGRCILDNLPGMLGSGCNIVGVLTRSGRGGGNNAGDQYAVPVYTDLNELLDQKPDVIAECAGQQALKLYGAEVLRQGISLVVSSVGALADDVFFSCLKEASIAGNSRIYLPAGAIGGIDALSAAKIGGLISVCYRARKPASAWKGTPAEMISDLDTLEEEQVIYSGSAREAAIRFPKNSNVAATVALAGIGFDETQVELIADPTIRDNIHEISAEGQSGQFQITLTGKPSIYNPKTSALAAFSITRCLANLESAIVI